MVSHIDIDGIGRVNLRILVDEEKVNQDKSLAIVRDSGMLITDRLGSMRITRSRPWSVFRRVWNGFTAVVECLTQDSRSLLREAEGPSHDEISADNADDDERRGCQECCQGAWQSGFDRR